MASKEEVGGYDHRLFLDQKAAEEPRYNCAICTKVFRDPHLTACCGQHFCGSCLEKWLERQKNCPNCRQEEFQHFVDKNIMREINSLKVKCPNSGVDGCTTTKIALGLLTDHLQSEKGCPYALVKCPNECKTNFHDVKSVKRKNLKYHLKNKCPNRRSKCTYCGLEETQKNISFHKVAFCREVDIECEACGKKDIKRKDRDNHYSQCPLLEISCPFVYAGCKNRFQRRHLPDHMEKNIQEHLLLMGKTVQELKQREQAVSMQVGKMIEKREFCLDTLQSIHSIINDRYHLKEVGDSVELLALFTPPSENEVHVFITEPFYFLEGYKMDLVFRVYVYPTDNEDEYEDCSITSSLRILSGEFDDDIPWPLESKDFCLNISFEDLSNSDISATERDRFSGVVFTLKDEIPICPDCCKTLFHTCIFEGQVHTICTTMDDITSSAAVKLIEEKKIELSIRLSGHRHTKKRRRS